MIFNKVWKMQRRARKLSAAYAKKVESLRALNKTETDIDMIVDEERNVLNQLYVDIAYAESDAMIEKASRLKVPRPAKTDTESWDTFFGVRYLTEVGHSKLRSSIRQERKERREAITSLAKDVINPIGSLIVSILSLLIAYAALKLKH